MSATITDSSGMKACADIGYSSGMTISDWAWLDGAPKTITADEYRRQHAEAVGLTLEQFDRYIVVVECDCGEEGCTGWGTIPRDRWKRDQRDERRKARELQPHYVYFAQFDGLIKIGTSTNPESRAGSLNASLLGYCPGNRELESELHTEFADLRERGEWFRPDARLLDRIGALCE